MSSNSTLDIGVQPETSQQPSPKVASTMRWVSVLAMVAGVASLAALMLHGEESSDTIHTYPNIHPKPANPPVPTLEIKPKEKLKKLAPEKPKKKPIPPLRKKLSAHLGLPAPMPSTLKGAFLPAVPGGPGFEVGAKDAPQADLHTLEAQVRVLAIGYGATVKSVHNAKGARGLSRTMLLSVEASRANHLADRIRDRIGENAMVSDPEADPSTPADADESVQLTTEEATLEKLKEQIKKAEVTFYADAPALKNLKDQYTQQLETVAKLKKSVKVLQQLTVILTTSI